MDKEIIHAYLWQKIIHIGFNPTGTANINKWLKLYNQSLKDFWELDQYPPVPSSQRGNICAPIDSADGLSFEYTIYYSLSKFGVRFLYPPTLMWIHDVDHSFFGFPQQTFLSLYNKGKQALTKTESLDIETIVDSLLCHPRVHQHIEAPELLCHPNIKSQQKDTDDIIDQHEIRIGAGIDNPFVFLFHLRYQLCLHEKKRTAERQRLIKLFFSAIKDKRDRITPNELMKQPE